MAQLRRRLDTATSRRHWLISLSATVLLMTSAIGAFAETTEHAAPRGPLDGDAKRGELIYRKCASCHMIGPGAKSRTGPPLNEIFGRRAAAVEGFKYSKGLIREGADGLVWSADKLDIYITNPQSLVTRTRMKFAGLPDAGERADLIAFLRTYSVSPQDIPESAPTAMARDPDVSPEILAIVGDPDYGEYLSGECVTCHQSSGEDKGIPSITGWPSDVFVTVMHAYKTEARPHPVMRMMAGKLSEEEIAALAAYFETLTE